VVLTHDKIPLQPLRGVILNTGNMVKAIAVLLLLIIGVFMVRVYWADMVLVLVEIPNILRETRIRYVILAVSVYVLSVYLFAVRWKQVLACIGYNLKAPSLFPVYFGAIFVTNVTPGGNMVGGESFRILWANKRFGISYTDALKSVVFERLVEGIPIALLFIYVLYSFPALERKFFPRIDNLSLNSSHLLFLTFLTAGMTSWSFRSFRAQFTSLLKDVKQDWKQLKKSFIPVLLLSCGIWILDVLRFKLVALALNINLSLNLAVTLSILSFLLEALPLTPGGVGIVEGSLISLLLYLGLPLGSAGSFVFLERFISYWISSVIGLLFLFYCGGFNIWRKQKKKGYSD
jgi:glycosyltransferase 2 family protein